MSLTSAAPRRDPVRIDAAQTVEGLGGALEFDSELGRGTRVTVLLPVAQAATA